ncbi:MAG: response regulator [Limisphaerales bacterium]
MKILVADDSRVSRNLAASILEDMDFEVLTAVDGLEAWKIFEREEIPLLVSDWMMPEMDGLELCSRVRAAAARRPGYTYIMMVTGLDGLKNFVAGMSAGADDFIVKPFEPEMLRCRIRVAQRVLAMQHELRSLAAALPFCGECDAIRSDPASVQRMHDFLSAHPELKPVLGRCPACAGKV